MAELKTYNIPGQPALESSPLEDAFKVLAAYVGGQAAVKQQEMKQSNDLLRTMVDSGMVDVDLSGGLTKPKYSMIPKAERPAYMETMAKVKSYEASAVKDLAEAASWGGGITGQAPTVGGNSVQRAKADFARIVSGLPREEKQALRNQIVDPRQRSVIKQKLVKKYMIEAVTADQWLDEVAANAVK